MSEINWKGVDLNLLLTFEAIMNHRSVSRAAEQLHIGQSAMSYNLSRLRKLLNDPLFERQGHIMVPTRRAEELAYKITGVLEVIRNDILFPQSFDPARSQHKLTIGLSDYAELVFGPVLFDQLIEEAPESQIVFQAIDAGNCQNMMEQGSVDLAIGVFTHLPDSMSRTTLYRERHVCMFDNETLGVALPISLEDYLATPQAMVSVSGQLSSPVDNTLSEMDVSRRVILGSSRFLTLRHLMSGRKLLCVMAEMVGRADLFSDQLTLSAPPIEIPDFNVELVMRRRDTHHPRMSWLCERVTSIIQQEVEQLRKGS
ncbi:LysR family transcriptional regulator [Endozoicomonas arenosclerae]|uniref:LysR family transcriptional regulator n=1 Tax=Endozoicomonas arenosclerae TaxID=1633495 RepID=UPI000780723A|nr:LysR family transcriptional regulator [Endozoicomonas arenosclerae]